MLKYYLDKTGKVIKSILFPSSEFVDTEPRKGSLNPLASGAVANIIPQDATKENPLMTAEDTERMIDVMKPIDAMTLRFEFSKKDYSPVVAGVGSAGTWTKVDSPTLNIWDWTNEGTDWSKSFKGAFPDENNEVRVIAAGDTSSVTDFSYLFAGTWSGTIGTANYVLTKRNNIIRCVPFNVSSATNTTFCFSASALQEVVKFDYSNTESCDAGFLFADSFVHDFDEIELYVTRCLSIFSMCYNLVHVGKIKFDDSKLVVTGLSVKEVSLFNVASALNKPMNIESIEEISGLGSVEDFSNLFARLRKLKRIGGSIDCSSLKYAVAMFQSCENLEHLPVLYNIGNSNVESLYLMCSGCSALKEGPVLDTSHVTDARNVFVNCYNFKELPDYDFSSVTKVSSYCRGCKNVSKGIIETYNKFLDRGASITAHDRVFENCGIDTNKGRAALAKIPQSWGGLAEG